MEASSSDLASRYHLSLASPDKKFQMPKIQRFFSSMLNRPPSLGAIPTFVEEKTLPKLIHQTFPHKNLPPELEANAKALQALNPTWQYNLYDDADITSFIKSAYGDSVYARYEQIDPTYGAARADLFRYLLMYKLGGVYLDIKSAATKPLDSVFQPNERYVIAQWPSGPGAKFTGAGWHEETSHIPHGEFMQWFVVASPGHPFLKAVVENVLRNLTAYNPALHGVGKRGVLRVTGPIAYTLAIQPLLDQHAHRKVNAENDLGFDYSIYPTVDKGQHQHLDLFKTHYSRSKTSVVRLTGLNAVVTPPVLAAVELLKTLRQARR